MLLRLITYFVVGLFAYLLIRRTLTQRTVRAAPRQEPDMGVAQLVQDPHCGVYVDRAEAVERKVPGGLLFFCSERCADEHFRTHGQGAAG